MAALDRNTSHADATELHPRVQHLFGTAVSIYSKIIGNDAVMKILNGVHLPKYGDANRILPMLAGRSAVKSVPTPQWVSEGVQAQGAHSSLLDLSVELREIIYGYVLDDMKFSFIAMHDSRRFPKVVPSWCFANKQIYAEVQPVFIRKKSWIVGCEPEFLSVYLLRIPNNPFLCLRSLWISLDLTSIRDSKDTMSQLHFLLREATALRELHIRISARDLCVIDVNAPQPRITIKSEEHLIAELQPNAWFQSDKLEVLWIEPCNDELFTPSRPEGEELGSSQFFDVCETFVLFVDKIVKTKPGVKLEVMYSLDDKDYIECELGQTGYIKY